MKKSRFTLVELLVVVAIILILLALLFPALRTARDRVTAVGCAGNLRQIALFMVSYAGNNNDTLPRMSSHPQTGVPFYTKYDNPDLYIGFFEALEWDQKGIIAQNANNSPILTERIFLCPRTPQARLSSKDAMGHLWKSYNTFSILTFGHNADSDYSPYPNPWFYSRVVKPATKSAVVDGRSALHYFGDSGGTLSGNPYIPGAGRAGLRWGGSMASITDTQNNRDYGEVHGFKSDFFKGRHGLSLNILFFDGHVENVSPKSKVTRDFHFSTYGTDNNMFNRQKP